MNNCTHSSSKSSTSSNVNVPDGSRIKNATKWNEIDNLFNRGKEEKRKNREREENDKVARKEKKNKRQKIEPSKTDKHSSSGNEVWVDDGLGGKFNSEGFTGRVEDGVRVFKAHILSKPGAGSTPMCPFDCECCFI